MTPMEALRGLRDNLRQWQRNAEESGEADFYTGLAEGYRRAYEEADTLCKRLVYEDVTKKND